MHYVKAELLQLSNQSYQINRAHLSLLISRARAQRTWFPFHTTTSSSSSSHSPPQTQLHRFPIFNSELQRDHQGTSPALRSVLWRLQSRLQLQIVPSTSKCIPPPLFRPKYRFPRPERPHSEGATRGTHVARRLPSRLPWLLRCVQRLGEPAIAPFIPTTEASTSAPRSTPSRTAPSQRALHNPSLWILEVLSIPALGVVCVLAGPHPFSAELGDRICSWHHTAPRQTSH